MLIRYYIGGIEIYLNGGTLKGDAQSRIYLRGIRMVKAKKVNPSLLGLIEDLKEASRKNKAPIWRDVALRLEKSRKNWPSVNVGKIGVILKGDEVALIPGKVLGDGNLAKKIEVAAFNFSSSAKDKIKTSGGKVLTIEELVSKNPKGTNVRIIK